MIWNLVCHDVGDDAYDDDAAETKKIKFTEVILTFCNNNGNLF